MTEQSDQSDAELARRIRDGDDIAFRSLYYRYYEALTSFVFHRTSSVELAKDFVQEVYTRLWQKRDKIDDTKSIKSYLYRIANNLAIDYFRKNASRRTYVSTTMQRSSGTADESIETQTAINMAIQKLPEKLRTVFTLSRYEGLKYAEIAEVCQVSVKTIESRMSQALQFLRKEL